MRMTLALSWASLTLAFAGACSSTTNQEDARDTGGVGTGGAGGVGGEGGTPSMAGTATGGTVTGGAGAGGAGGAATGGLPNGGQSGDGGAGGEAGIAGSPATGGTDPTLGCRGPLDDYCATCCEMVHPTIGSLPPYCVENRAEGGADWYNAGENVDDECPTNCPACAPCSYQDEASCNALPDRPDCDCATITIGLDPCFAPDGCRCYCSRVRACVASCPHLAP